jgi:RNA polymerase sigma-70 factor (ECF subfamily)
VVELAVKQIATRVLAEATARWPGLGDHTDAFVEALTARIDGEPDVDEALARLVLPDIYLVAACLANDRVALAAFERLVRSEVARALARTGDSAAADDVAQELLVKLLVARDGRPAKLAAYGGHGALTAWLRVAAVRIAISDGRRRRESPLDEHALAEIVDAGDDQALAFLKASYRDAFKRAFDAALASLEPRQRTLLRLQIIDQLTLEEIGAYYRVSRATTARWLADARTALVEATRTHLAGALGLPDRELADMMRLVASSLYSTLPRLLSRVTVSAT